MPPENFEETIEESVDCMTEKKTPGVISKTLIDLCSEFTNQ